MRLWAHLVPSLSPLLACWRQLNKGECYEWAEFIVFLKQKMKNTVDTDNTSSIKLLLGIETESIGHLVTAAVGLITAFSIFRNYIYYVLLLHVPIFQYLAISDVVLMSTSTIWLTVYISLMLGMFSIIDHWTQLFADFSWKKVNWGAVSAFLLALIFTITTMHLVSKNDPSADQLVNYLIYYPYTLVPFVIFIILAVIFSEKIKPFYSKYKISRLVLMMAWFSIFDPIANYAVLNSPKAKHVKITFKEKSAKSLTVIKDSLIFAGRTNNYWFIYDKADSSIRVLKNDDLDSVKYYVKNF
jgi:hypothetical protein